MVWRVERSHLNDASVSDVRAGGMIFSVDENGARAAEDMVRMVMGVVEHWLMIMRSDRVDDIVASIAAKEAGQDTHATDTAMLGGEVLASECRERGCAQKQQQQLNQN